MILYIVSGILVGIGCYLILADRLNLPHSATRSAVLALTHANRESGLERLLCRLVDALAKHMPMNPFARTQLAGDLFSAGDSRSPEQYKATAVVHALLVAVLAIPASFLFPILAPVVLVLAVYMYRHTLGLVHIRLKERRSKLEYELPSLVYNIEKSLKHSRDMVGILEEYAQHAGPELQHQLNITTADMRSGNYEAALTRLEARVGSAQLSDVCRGIISTVRGDETEMYWTGLSIKFNDYQRQKLRLQAQKMPQKVRWLSMALLFCFVLMYIVVIISQIVSSMGMMF